MNRFVLFFCAIALCFSGCVKDLEEEGIHTKTTYKGRVIEKSQNAPMKGVTVSISDGTHVHSSIITEDDGCFEFNVDISEINADYAIHLECQGYSSMTEVLKGMGQEVYDYKDIIFFDKENTANWPTVATTAVTNITSTSARTGGNIVYSGPATITARGVCYDLTHEPTIDGNHTSDGSGVGSFVSNLTGLTPNTTYYVRAYATNQNGTYYGEEQELCTITGLPTVTIDNVTNITASSAVCGGNIVSNGGFAITDKGLVWSTAQYPTLNDSRISLGNGDAAFVGSMNNLSINTTYYVRAYATNSQGTTYSSQKSFTTNVGLPAVTTTKVTLNGNTVVSGGNVTDDGGFAITARGICYGTYPNPDLTSAYTHTSNGTGTGYFTSVINSFTSGTLYVRAYATNANGTSYGNEIAVDYNYLSLPTFTYNGHTYKVAPDPNTSYTQYISWHAAIEYCENLTSYGYSDWKMPNITELETMYANRQAIGGFINYYTEDDGYVEHNSNYWSSTYENGDDYYDGCYDHYYHLCIDWHLGERKRHDSDGYYHGGTYGQVYWYYHVRPIRIDE